MIVIHGRTSKNMRLDYK